MHQRFLHNVRKLVSLWCFATQSQASHLLGLIILYAKEDTNTISYGVFYKDTGNNPILKKVLIFIEQKIVQLIRQGCHTNSVTTLSFYAELPRNSKN